MMAARAIAAIENPSDVACISGKPQGQRAILKFGSNTGATPVAGRYTPGAFTNQNQTAFREPRLLIVTDPRVDHQARVLNNFDTYRSNLVQYEPLPNYWGRFLIWPIGLQSRPPLSKNVACDRAGHVGLLLCDFNFATWWRYISGRKVVENVYTLVTKIAPPGGEIGKKAIQCHMLTFKNAHHVTLVATVYYIYIIKHGHECHVMSIFKS